MAMTYRKLTTDEIIQLGQELENFQRWERVRDYVETLYPPQAHSITVSVTSLYNDSSYDENVHVLVADAAGDLLPFDFTRPWWKQYILTEQEQAEIAEDKSGAIENISEPMSDAIRDLCTDLLGIEFVEFWQPHDPVTYEYVVATPPTISYLSVFTEE
jgi:hypothetical protein